MGARVGAPVMVEGAVEGGEVGGGGGGRIGRGTG